MDAAGPGASRSRRAALPRPRTFRALRHRDFRLFWLSQVFSLSGAMIQRVAQGWLVYRLTGSPFYLGLVGFAGLIPILFFSLVAGSVADRVDKRRLLVIVQLLALFQAALLAFLTYSGLVEVWHIVVLALFLGTVTAFDIPTRQAMVVELVGKRDLMNAIALNSTLFNAARVAGPAVAGLIIAALGEATAFAINGATYVFPTVALLAMSNRPKHPAEIATLPQQIRDALSYVWHTPAVRHLMTLIAVSAIFGVQYVTLMPAVAQAVLGVGARDLGFMMAAPGLGALTGALIIASLSESRPRGGLLTLGNLLFGLCLLLFSLSRSLELSLLLLVGVGLGFIFQAALTNSLIQGQVPDGLRGGVMGLYAVMFAGMSPIGSLLAGFAADRLGTAVTLGYGALVCLLYAVFVWWRLPWLRRL